MLRPFVIALAIAGLAALIIETPNASAVPAEQPQRDCLGQLHSALIHTGYRVTTRDPKTGAIVVLDRTSNPGDFRGAAGVDELLTLFEGLALRGCQIPIFRPGDCVDFRSDTQCGSADSDGDSYLDFLEAATGSDPTNEASTPEFTLLDEQTGSRTCGDRVDNDLDGRTDNGDSGCRLTCEDFGGKHRCPDSDHDGWRKYVEDMYGSDPTNRLSTPESIAVPSTCNDGLDNDSDDYSDSLDFGCDPSCGIPGRPACDSQPNPF